MTQKIVIIGYNRDEVVPVTEEEISNIISNLYLDNVHITITEEED